MTPQSRAEKILDEWDEGDGQKNCDAIAAQIAEAEREAVKRELFERLQNLQDNKAYEAGYAAARESAVKIAVGMGDEGIAQTIRVMGLSAKS